MSPNTIFISLLLSIMIPACASREKLLPGSSEKVVPGITLGACPKDGCTVIGRVRKIHAIATTNVEDVCSKAPCMATLSIEQILQRGGKGSDIPMDSKGIVANFRFTTAETSGLFPNLAKIYPGVSENDRIKANIITNFDVNTQDTSYTVIDYLILTKEN